VTGASDKTLRQWDLATGQCVMTIDILWAISHSSTMPAGHLPGATAAAGAFAVLMPPYADGSWELYQDFHRSGAIVGICSREWERGWHGTDVGYTHRSGPPARSWDTGPVTCFQFDEIHVVSGSLDKSVRVR
jgi:mitochondrial division protein 1